MTRTACVLCGAPLRRSVGLPLCAAAFKRAWELCREVEPIDEFNAVSRRNRRFWSDGDGVIAALLADRAQVA